MTLLRGKALGIAEVANARARPMKADRWTEIREVFAAALDQTTDQRDAFLDRRCAGDDALRREVDDLLAADAGARGGAFLRDAVREAARRLAGVRESDASRRYPT